MFGNEQPKVARDMLVQGAALAAGLLTLISPGGSQ